MVATLVEGLRGDPEIEILHVNVRLSHGHADIGRARAGKLWPLLCACAQAWRTRLRHGRCALYYVPAPGARNPLWRDFIVMALCRPFFSTVIFHWHAIGLGAWIATRATALERSLAHALLDRADLAIVLAPELAEDAKVFAPRRVSVVPNCIADPVAAPRTRVIAGKFQVLFLGQCSRAKGLFDALEGIALAERAEPGMYHLTVAGGFASEEERHAFDARSAELPCELVTYAGFADDAQKRALLSAAHVFCFPTAYPHEGQPLALIEALAYDVPIVTTRWRAIPGMLPRENVHFVDPGKPEQVADALRVARHTPPGDGGLRRHYLAHFTPQQHLATLKSALLQLRSEAGTK